jgi:hypothetical protein
MNENGEIEGRGWNILHIFRIIGIVFFVQFLTFAQSSQLFIIVLVLIAYYFVENQVRNNRIRNNPVVNVNQLNVQKNINLPGSSRKKKNKPEIVI